MSGQKRPEVPTMQPVSHTSLCSWMMAAEFHRSVQNGASECKGRREASGARVTSSFSFPSPENCSLSNFLATLDFPVAAC